MTSWIVWGDLGRDASPGGGGGRVLADRACLAGVLSPMTEEPQPSSPNNVGDWDGGAHPRVDLVIGG